MKVLITGINGFVGHYLKEYFLAKGDEVFGFDLGGEFSNAIFKCDITNADEVADVIKKTLPDKIFHLAGFSSVKKSFDQPDLTWKINYEGAKNLLDAVLKFTPGAKVLLLLPNLSINFTSTISMDFISLPALSTSCFSASLSV